MTKKYRKVILSPEVFEDGGATAVFVDKETIPLDGAIKDAIAGNYAIGNATLIRNTFFGLMRSMADGVRRDGRPRQIAGLITVYPVFKGPVDLERGFDPEANGVMIRARLLKDIEIDISDWTFEDVTPGKRPFRLTTVKAGDTDGEIVAGQPIEINGKDVPNVEAGEPCAVEWRLVDGTKSGDVAAEKITGNISRIDLAVGAVTGLEQSDAGKEIEFTVRGNFSNARIKAVYVGLPPSPDHKITKLDGSSEDWAAKATSFAHEEEETYDTWLDTDGEETLHVVEGDACAYWFEDTAGTRHEGACQLVNKGDDEVVFKVPVDDAAALNAGDVVHYRAVLHAGVPGTAGHVIEWTSTVID